jgi:hypothetical protein
MKPAILSADPIASLHRWYVACGLLPDDSGQYRVKRNDAPQPQGASHEQVPQQQNRKSHARHR